MPYLRLHCIISPTLFRSHWKRPLKKICVDFPKISPKLCWDWTEISKVKSLVLRCFLIFGQKMLILLWFWIDDNVNFAKISRKLFWDFFYQWSIEKYLREDYFLSDTNNLFLVCEKIAVFFIHFTLIDMQWFWRFCILICLNFQVLKYI